MWKKSAIKLAEPVEMRKVFLNNKRSRFTKYDGSLLKARQKYVNLLVK